MRLPESAVVTGQPDVFYVNTAHTHTEYIPTEKVNAFVPHFIPINSIPKINWEYKFNVILFSLCFLRNLLTTYSHTRAVKCVHLLFKFQIFHLNALLMHVFTCLIHSICGDSSMLGYGASSFILFHHLNTPELRIDFPSIFFTLTTIWQ